uniref:HTH arsR-type domain-containing protein n=1 Tax=Thermosporothrix sp. COM3 TaxID=2490863 RepID=A0A455SQJ3_9CHLR|nr:hypothetical protein KTC_21550 [Thermosporothrix sp. COM3]
MKSKKQIHHSPPRKRDKEQERYLSEMLAILGQSSRWKILRALAPLSPRQPLDAIEYTPSELAEILGLSVSTISEHLHALLKAQLVTTQRFQRSVYYRLRHSATLLAFFSLLDAIEEQAASDEHLL